MKNIFKLNIILAMLILVVSSCEEEEKLAYKGSSQVYFFDSSISELFLFTGAGQEEEFLVDVNLLGQAVGSDITVTVEVDESSTAVEGVHYEFTTNTVTIPAGEYGAQLPITALLDGFNGDPELTVNLVLNIVSAQGVEVANAVSQATLSLSITCPSEIPEGTYHEINTGTGGAARAVQLTSLGGGRYELSQMNFAYYNAGYADIPGEFIDVCNELTLQGVPVGAAYGIAWIGTGVYNPTAKTLSFTVSDATYNPDYPVDMVFELQE